MLGYLNKKITHLFLVVVLLFIFSFQAASAKSYSYDLINVFIKINQDSTFDVEEQQTFNYTGEYHNGWRSISLNKTDQISDMEVVDGETGKPLVYSSKRLDKLDPESWGRFTYFKEKGAQNIEWYYNLSDVDYKWIIKYKVHGGIGFFSDSEELYWNIFTDYDAPVKEASAFVSFPDGVDLTSVKAGAFRNNDLPEYSINKEIAADNKSIFFRGFSFDPQEDFTVKIDWPKGFVSQSAYWQDFLRIYILYILIFLITIVNIFFIAMHWYFNEVRPVGRGTIIPQYTPPENLRPAMAEVLLKEKVTDKGWSATVIDLAVRGYIKIKEDTADWTEVLSRVVLFFVFIFFIFVFLSPLLHSRNSGDVVYKISFGLFIFFVLFVLSPLKTIFLNMFKVQSAKDLFVPKNYIITKTELFETEKDKLEDYEKRFLEIIFRYGSDGSFSTKIMKKAGNAKKRRLYEAMKSLESALYDETTADTGAFETGVEKEKIGYGILAAAIILPLFVLSFFPFFINAEMFFVYIVLLNIVTIYVYLKYEARLSRRGFILKEDWLGFKVYLETAERYRMQNLTPETFERYLPYAIIFSIEEKWGRAFESLNIRNPSWYSGAYAGVGIHSGGVSSGGGFSPTGFSASFSSSFSSAFSSAGGAGSSGGGGGGAGGGGGGGGGGAS